VIYVVEFRGHRVRHISATGTISTVAGTGVAGFGETTLQLNNPTGAALAQDGALLISDRLNQRVRAIQP
jgi:hypothetical protein